MTSIPFLFAVFLSATTWTTGQGSTGYTDKYPHEGSGYSFINVDDGCSGDLAVGSSFSIPIGTSKYHHLYVTSNGLISLASCSTHYNPLNFYSFFYYIAPYWTDLYPAESEGSVSYRVFLNRSDTFDLSILERAERDIRHFDWYSITATWVLVATWNNVVFHNDDSQQVTVQCVLITDGVSTYTVFNYLDVDAPGAAGRNVFMGWYCGNGNHLLDQSFTTQALNMSRIDGNQGVPGFWFFKLAPGICESSPCKNGATCEDKYEDFICHCQSGFTSKDCESGPRSQFYCNTSDLSVMYCKYGCCGHGSCQHCCKNEIAIGYITAFVIAVAMVITGGVVTFLITRRLTKTNREREFRTIETQTEIKIHPAKEWKTTSDPLQGKLYAVNGHITSPPSGVIDRIVQMRKSRARTSKERKDKDDPESRMSVTTPVHDIIERPISRFDSLSSIKGNDEVVELDVF